MQLSLPLVAFPTVAEIVPEPLGVVLVFSSWNFPLGNVAQLGKYYLYSTKINRDLIKKENIIFFCCQKHSHANMPSIFFLLSFLCFFLFPESTANITRVIPMCANLIKKTNSQLTSLIYFAQKKNVIQGSNMMPVVSINESRVARPL